MAHGQLPPSSLMKRFGSISFAVVCALLWSCASMKQGAVGGAQQFKITTKSREAQRAFDRGLTLAYGFAYTAAEEEFRAAAAADPSCAMAWWGVALANGRHIN